MNTPRTAGSRQPEAGSRFLHPLRWAQARIDAWVLARVKRQPGPVVIGRGRVYILPTRFGYGFGLMLVVMLLGAMNYSNSMIFLLTFLLAGIGLVCMHHTHANLANLQLRIGDAAPAFVGEIAHFEVLVDNPAARPRWSLGLSWPKAEPQATYADLPARESRRLRLSLPASTRGWLPARVFSLHSDYPLGLFHAWTWAELDMACLVFPQPAAAGISPPGSNGHGGYASSARSGQDEFAGLRNYQRGDALRSVHWKSLPKLQAPMVKQFAETLEQELWLDWDALAPLDAETRLSQLTRWVLDAEAEQRSYGLKMPGLQLPPSRGAAHQFHCLKILALHPQTSGAA